ncbi:MAG: helix-turn-helix domain-containing protein [Pseudonocardiaceae bacterium]
MEREAPPEGATIHRITDQPAFSELPRRQSPDRAAGGDTDPGRDEPVAGGLRREHWTVPVHGLTRADPDGIAQAIAHRDGVVVLDLTCGASRTTVWFDVSRAAQLCTGIWEAAGAAQHLSDGRLPPSRPLHGSDDLPQAWRARPPRDTAPRPSSPSSGRQKLTLVTTSTAMDATRMIARYFRRVRHARKKSLEAVGGLAGMSRTKLHHIEHGRRELTLAEIVALADALQIDSTKLITLPILAPAGEHPVGGAAQPRTG